jgi:hypothetical protein
LGVIYAGFAFPAFFARNLISERRFRAMMQFHLRL